MKPIKTKAQVRQEIGLQVREFLARGGKVNGVAPGVSGRDINIALPVSFEPQRATRTPVLAEIKALESRKAAAQQKKPISRKPRKQLIKDDFGEPIRWIWKED